MDRGGAGRGRGRGRSTGPGPQEEEEERIVEPSRQELFQRRYEGSGEDSGSTRGLQLGLSSVQLSERASPSPLSVRGRTGGRGFSKRSHEELGVERDPVGRMPSPPKPQTPPAEELASSGSPTTPSRVSPDQEVNVESPPGGPGTEPQVAAPMSVGPASTAAATSIATSIDAGSDAGTGGASLDSAGNVRKHREQEGEPVVQRGTKGMSFKALTNYLRLELKEGKAGIVEYHVSIKPPIESVGMRKHILRQFDKQLGIVRSFDGMVLFLPHILPNDVTVLEGMHPSNEQENVTVHVTFIKVKPMKEALVFFNILLHRIMKELAYIELRREFYDLAMVQSLTQHKMEIWPGTAVTAENQENGLMICVDTCSRVLRTETVLEYLKLLRDDPQRKEKFTQFIVTKIVLTRYNNKTYRIDDVAWDMSPETEFEFSKGKQTFTQYMKSTYNISVRDMQQPMLISRLKPRKNDRTANPDEVRLAALIPELCFITGLTDDQRSNFKVMTDLATATRLTPQQRCANMKQFLTRLKEDERAQLILNNWGLEIKDIISVDARRLEGPTLMFSKRPGSEVKNIGPDFSRESGHSVYDPVDVRNYIVLCTQRDSDKARRFIDCYKQVCQPLGIKMLQLGEIVNLGGMQPHDFRKALTDRCDPNKLHFLVIIMPTQRDDVYGAIKRFCVAGTPIPSQCILSKTLGNEKRLRSIVLKIALQINCKLGGSLWALKMPLKEDIMFVGIDAAHDPLKKEASVVCLVTSVNNECTKYFSRSTTSKVHQELTDCLRTMMGDALTYFRKNRGKYPDRIIVFRDGGSVGAFDAIETTEMNQIKKAIEEDHELVNLPFSFLIVAKRIPQRFYAITGRDVNNPQPGSIFDSGVTLRYMYDFYVVSQVVRQGTVNPTHFIVLETGTEIRPDLIQRFAYVTTFMYYNWSGTVRVPAMVQYAHKLAALLSRHVKTAPHREISGTLYYL